MTGHNDKNSRAQRTRATILATAEQLFAEQGIMSVSNRQISEAAGQGNNTAVGYHFDSKDNLIRAIVRKHEQTVEHIRTGMVRNIDDPAQVREWAQCLVCPLTAHLAAIGSPSWYARFLAQLTADPALHEIIAEEILSSPALLETIDGFNRCLPELPPDVRVERSTMTRHLIVTMCAERERALAARTATTKPSWLAATAGLIDAILGLYMAPVTPLPTLPRAAHGAASALSFADRR